MRTSLWILYVAAAVVVLPCGADSAALIIKANMDELTCEMPDENYRLTGGAPGMLFIGDEDVTLELAFKKGGHSGEAEFAIEIQEIGTRTPGRFAKPDDLVGTTAGMPLIDLIGKPVTHPLKVTFGDADEVAFTVEKLPAPKRFGTFALVLVCGEKQEKRQFLGTFCRLPQPREYGHIENTPVFGEGQIMYDRQYDKRAQQYYRMGVRGWRSELHWSEDAEGNYRWDDYDKIFDAASAAGLKVMVTLGAHPQWTWAFPNDPTPASGWRPDTSGYSGTGDWLCKPELYPRYEKWVTAFCERYWKDGKGPLWGLENYNEPWEGGGISGWARDCLEYREIQRTIARGARKVSPDIRILAASSIMNTEDKLYSDGSDEFDQYVDVFTDHYVVPANCYGPMVAAKRGKWSMETETWFVNAEYLLPQAVAQFMASGQKRIAPWHPSMLFDAVPGVDDARLIPAPVVAATAAFNYFVTGKEFERVVFLDHLPWVFQFGKDDDKDALLVMFGQLFSIGDDSPKARPWAQVDSADGGEMTIDNGDGLLKFYDLAGNPTYVGEKTVTLPMTIFPTYILCDKGPKAAAERIKAAKITGKRPVEIIPRDFDRPLTAEGASLTVEITNRLNRDISGTLKIIPPKEIPLFNLVTNGIPLAIPAGATLTVKAKVDIDKVTPLEGNAYPFSFIFNTADDHAKAEYAETLHVTAAPKRTFTIDGNLDDWKDIPGVTVIAGAVKADKTELMRRPWLDLKDQLPDGSFAEFKLAWDENYLYIAARVRDKTPDATGPRLEGRDEDDYFHSAASDNISPYKEFLEKEQYKGKSFADVPWVYRRSPEANSPYRRDRLQIAISASLKHDGPRQGRVGGEMPVVNWHDLTPTTDRVPFGFHAVPDTDYEYSLYLCGDGKSECWRLLAPGVPRIHDYPRQPRGEKTTGPVKGAKHVVKLDGDTFIYELAIPREEIPTVKLEPGTTLGIMLRAGDSRGMNIDLGVDKAATKLNGLTLHPYWERTMDCGMRWTLTK